MDTFVILKKPGEPAVLLPAPARVDLEFLQALVGGHLELFPQNWLPNETLRPLTLVMNGDGELEQLEPNLMFEEGEGVLGPLVALLTNEAGDDHGLCREHAEAVAEALDGYGVRSE